VAWTIAGSDSGAGAGIQADLETFRAFGIHGANVLTAVTAQNTHDVTSISPLSTEIIDDQIAALERDLAPAAIKTGMIGTGHCVKRVAEHMARWHLPIVCDPVLMSGTGHRLSDESVVSAFQTDLFPKCRLITPNRFEAETLSGKRASPSNDLSSVAADLLKFGSHSVLLKGGHSEDPKTIQHYWVNSEGRSACLSKPRHPGGPFHGTGCTLSSAITASLALGHSELDALVLAEIFVSRSVQGSYRQGRGSALLSRPTSAESGFSPENLPSLNYHSDSLGNCFPAMSGRDLGFYPLVANANHALQLLKMGVKTLQIRIKTLSGFALDNEIAKTAQIARQYEARLFVNDYWDLAIKHNAYGIHLGQEDLSTADLKQISLSGLRLGISTHSYSEMARAHAFRPSYVAIGPVFKSTMKSMNFAPLLAEKFASLRRLFPYPVVAIGGITLERAASVIEAGADSIAVGTDVIRDQGLEDHIHRWLAKFGASSP